MTTQTHAQSVPVGWEIAILEVADDGRDICEGAQNPLDESHPEDIAENRDKAGDYAVPFPFGVPCPGAPSFPLPFPFPLLQSLSGAHALGAPFPSSLQFHYSFPFLVIIVISSMLDTNIEKKKN